MRLAFDIETDGLIPQLTQIHSLVVVDVDTGEGWSCTDHPGYTSPNGYKVTTIREGLRLLVEADQVIGHNIIKFDIPAIQKVEPWFQLRREQVRDTLIYSRLIWPEIRENDFKLRKSIESKLRKSVPEGEWAPEDPQGWVKEKLKERFPGNLIGAHGLEAWGYRLDEWKGDYSKEMKAKGLDPWANWNEDMQSYCEQDVTVTIKLLQKAEEKAYAQQAVELEHAFALICAEMERNGFPFHMERAQRLQHKLMKRHTEIKQELAEAFPPITEEWSFTPKANNSKLGYVKGVPTTKSKVIEFNPSSRQHIAKWLGKHHGWKPKEYTENGQAKVDETILKKLPYPEAKLLAEYFLLDKRLGMLENQSGKGLIPASKRDSQGIFRIHGGVNTIGAVTRRCTHASPNMAQIPANNVPFGKDFRGLMYAPAGWTLIGWDASGLELRCLAHYMGRYDGGAYAEIVLNGDIHWAHVIALGLVPEGTERFAGTDENGDPIHVDEHERLRGVAKRFIYAFLYGAGPEKIGETLKPTASSAAKRKLGKQMIATFLKKVPALARLKKDLANAIKKRNGKLLAIDGGEMHIRSPHAALNTLLQSAGAISVKLATVLFYDKLIEKGLRSGEDFMLVAHVHDEVQTLCKKGLEDIVGETAQEAMAEAGEALGFKCPLSANFDPGSNWSETH